MKQLTCEMCGSTDLIKKDGVFVCQICGCKYSVEEARKMMIEGTVTIDGVVKTKSDDFEVRAGELIAYHGAETDVIIPDGIKIIGSICFRGMQGIESVTIPEGVYKIGPAAFLGCSGLKKITFPQSLAEIEGAAFKGCTSLKSVQLPDGIQTLGCSCFSGCTSLESINLPDSIQALETECFSGCTSLKSVQLPNNIQVLQRECFGGCTSLESIHIPNCIRHIGYHTFTGTPSLKTVESSALYINSLTAHELGMMATSGAEDVLEISSPWFKEKYYEMCKQERQACDERERRERQKNSGCYIATTVYGSYDCPQVWTLRRYRDYTLAETWYGRAFIRVYYIVSPTLVKWFGHTEWLKKLWKGKLDRMVCNLNSKGVEDTPYTDRPW